MPDDRLLVIGVGDGGGETQPGRAVRRWIDDILTSLVLGMVEGERRPGRPVRRWIDDILTSLVLGWWKVKDDQDDLYGDGSTIF